MLSSYSLFLLQLKLLMTREPVLDSHLAQELITPGQADGKRVNTSQGMGRGKIWLELLLDFGRVALIAARENIPDYSASAFVLKRPELCLDKCVCASLVANLCLDQSRWGRVFASCGRAGLWAQESSRVSALTSHSPPEGWVNETVMSLRCPPSHSFFLWSESPSAPHSLQH